MINRKDEAIMAPRAIAATEEVAANIKTSLIPSNMGDMDMADSPWVVTVTMSTTLVNEVDTATARRRILTACLNKEAAAMTVAKREVDSSNISNSVDSRINNSRTLPFWVAAATQRHLRPTIKAAAEPDGRTAATTPVVLTIRVVVDGRVNQVLGRAVINKSSLTFK